MSKSSEYITGYYYPWPATQSWYEKNPTELAVWSPGYSRYYFGVLVNAFDMSNDGPPSASPVNQNSFLLNKAKSPSISGYNDFRVVIGGDDPSGWNRPGKDPKTGNPTGWNNPGIPTTDEVTAKGIGRTSDAMTTETMRENINANGWDGADFDDEMQPTGKAFNYQQLTKLMGNLKSSTYTFVGGSNFDDNTNQIKTNLQTLVDSKAKIDNYQLMAYGGTMWPESAQHYVTSNLAGLQSMGVPLNKVMLGVTTNGLNKNNLGLWLDAIRALDNPVDPDTGKPVEKLNQTGEKLAGIFVYPGITNSEGVRQNIDPSLTTQITAALSSFDLDIHSDLFNKNNKMIGSQSSSKSKKIRGSHSSDIITGHNFSKDQKNKIRKTDTLIGKGGSDLFVVGHDQNHQHYSTNGIKDLALIRDFSFGQGDRIQLSGSRNDYSIKTSTYNGKQGLMVSSSQDSDELVFLKGLGSEDKSSLSKYGLVFTE